MGQYWGEENHVGDESGGGSVRIYLMFDGYPCNS